MSRMNDPGAPGAADEVARRADHARRRRLRAARKVYNGMIDRRPALIARCADVADVIAGVNFAREKKLPLAVRGGGHNGPGLGVGDGGLVIDLSRMRGIRVDPKARPCGSRAAPLGRRGPRDPPLRPGDPERLHLHHGRGRPDAGRRHRLSAAQYGLTIDNLLGVDVVLADGRLVTASAKENPDLFWAVRGGGGNFGVVTSFLFRRHPVSTVYGGPMLWPMEKAARCCASGATSSSRPRRR